MSLAVRVYGEDRLAAEVSTPPEPIERDPDDADIAIFPAVTIGPKALGMLEYAQLPPKPKKKPQPRPLRGSLQDRYQKELRTLRR